MKSKCLRKYRISKSFICKCDRGMVFFWSLDDSNDGYVMILLPGRFICKLIELGVSVYLLNLLVGVSVQFCYYYKCDS
jgi:hypothetical protein